MSSSAQDSSTVSQSSHTGSPTIVASKTISIGSLMSTSEKAPFLPSSTKIVILDRTNYLLWESQLVPILKSQDST
ncbi:hypothetical protein MKW98_014813, partial [Papaver atlanticum]